MRTQLPSPKGAQPPIFGHVGCGEMARWIKMPLGMEVGLCPGDIVLVLDGDPAPPKKLQSTPSFRPCLLWPNGRQSQLLLSSCTKDRPKISVAGCVQSSLARLSAGRKAKTTGFVFTQSLQFGFRLSNFTFILEG